MVVFPASYADEQREVIFTPPAGKPPLFIMLDGTWPEARKMFRKSPYLDNLPVISVDLLGFLPIACVKPRLKANIVLPR